MSVTSLSRILKSFSAPISEEHGWGVIYQACVALLELEQSAAVHTLLLVESPGQLLLTDDGSVDHSSFTLPGDNRRRMSTYAQAIAELGVVVYTALDFSLAEEETRALSGGLEHIIDMMTSADSDIDNSQEMEDEGIGEEERGKEVVEKVLSLCCHHLAEASEASQHYRGVVRALVAENKELSHFMSKLDEEQMLELDRDEWGIIWTTVMEQLRQGVKLKKADYSRTPVEFSLTPYEMLLVDIRARKYRLNPVKVSLEVQRGAREVILDFIRSRPPLKSVKNRKVAERLVQLTPQEELMKEIRVFGEGVESKLKKTQMVQKPELEGIKLGKVVSRNSSFSNVQKVHKKVIDVDESFAENILNFDDCNDGDDSDDLAQDDNKLTNEFYENNPDFQSNNNNNVLQEVPKIVINKPSSPFVLKSSLNPEPCSSPAAVKSKYSDWIKSLHTLDLSLAEVSHIRAQLSRAELEEMDLPPDQKRDYERGKICFQCGVVKFGLFTWAVQCQLCRRYVCSGCVGKITLPSEKLQDILVCTLTTQLSKDSTTQSKRLESPERTTRSLTNSFTRTFERHSFRSSDRARSTMPRGQETGSRPRLTRARSMDKGMVASLQAMKLTGSKTGIQHNVCKDCKDMLTSIVRAQRMANKLDRMRVGFTSRIGHGFDAMRE